MVIPDDPLRDSVYLNHEHYVDPADRLRMYRFLCDVASALGEVTQPDVVLIDDRCRSYEPAFMTLEVSYLRQDVDKILREREEYAIPWNLWQTKCLELLYDRACWNFINFEHRRTHGPDYFEAWRDVGRFVVDHVYSADWWGAVGRCTICLDDVYLPREETAECGHVFHSECILRWSRQDARCPNCRGDLA